MPEYLAPGVFVEETSFRSKSIEGVGTSTAAFVGLTARGPVSAGTGAIAPILCTSYADFERLYGGADDIIVGGAPMRNFLAHAASAFFANGGGRLYIARVLGETAARAASGMLNSDPATVATEQVSFSARFPGGSVITGTGNANLIVDITQQSLATTKALAQKQPAGTLIRAGTNYFVIGANPHEGTADAATFNGLGADTAVTIITLAISVRDGTGVVYEAGGLGLHAAHPRFVGRIFGANPPRSIDRLTNPVTIVIGSGVVSHELRTALLGTADTRSVTLTGGSNGAGAPTTGSWGEALNMLLAQEDVAIIAAPGASAFAAPTPAAVNQLLIGSAETRRAYRIAVLDAPPDTSVADVQLLKSRIDSTKAALYYPWVRVANPLAGTDPMQPSEIDLPPSGFVAGIYARTDIQRGVFKAPANETVTGALDLQTQVRFGEQEVLNPLGINCIRALPGRGIRVWGARTISSDPEWKYVNIRRYFLYLESSIDRGTQWAVFEPNGERLWANVRSTISDFLYNEWVNGALLGATPKEAFFVQCDRSTITQNDLDNGRLVCLVGVAAIKPAEFVIFRIGQTTADNRN